MIFTLDWLNERLAATPNRKEQQETIMLFIAGSSDFLVHECYQLALRLKKDAEEDGDEGLVVFCELYISMYERMTGKIATSIELLAQAEAALYKYAPSFSLNMVNHMIGFEYWAAGLRDKALKMSYEALRRAEEIGGESLGWANFQLAVFHFDMKDYDEALNYFRRSEAAARELGLAYQVARNYSGIGGVYIARNQLDEGVKYNEMALEGYRNVGHQTAISRALNDLGVIQYRRGNDAEAENYLREALDIRERSQYAPGIITSRIELARVLVRQQRATEARELLDKAMELAVITHSKPKIMQCHLLLAEVYKLDKEPWKALEHLQSASDVQGEIFGEETANRIKHLQQKHATEQSEQEAEIHRLKNVELKKAYDEIEEKNKNILDSINYARRIQRALLASDELLQKYLDSHFILYHPKDIVSGDFYWATERDGKFYFAVCDCTGHGVPGAFMSLLNATYLNQAVMENGLTVPAEILGEVRHKVVATLNTAHETEEAMRDGMDATLICLDKENRTLRFACANNPLLLFREGKLTVFGPDKFPVGLQPGNEEQPFTDHPLATRLSGRYPVVTVRAIFRLARAQGWVAAEQALGPDAPIPGD